MPRQRIFPFPTKAISDDQETKMAALAFYEI